MRGNVTGEQYAQVDNQDPFASPVWRSPVYRTPEAIIWIVQLVRLLVRVAWFLIRHPLLDAAAGGVILLWLHTGWPGVAGPRPCTWRRACWPCGSGGRIGSRGSWPCRCGAGGGGGSTGGTGTR